MRRNLFAVATALVVWATVSLAQADLTFEATKYAPAGATTDVRVVSDYDANTGQDRIVIQLACSFECIGFGGGFQATAPATFSQAPPNTPFLTSIATNDTAFFGSPTFPGLVTADNDSQLYTQGAVYLGQSWPGTGTGTFFDFAQIVLPANGVAQTVGEDGTVGAPIVFTDDNGQFVALLSGTVQAVPEPGSLLLMGMGLFGLGMVAQRRRRRA